MERLKRILNLFFSMLKTGLFTFGGGYAMLSLLRDEFVERKGWLDEDEFSDMVAIAESTPGPIAINAATYIGYKISSFVGAVAATVAVCIPSFVIIYLISLFFDKFLQFEWVGYAFRGIQVCVSYLILSAGIKMVKGIKKNVFNIILIVLTVAVMLALTLFSVNFSSVFYILIGGAAGIFAYLFALIKKKKEKDK